MSKLSFFIQIFLSCIIKNTMRAILSNILQIKKNELLSFNAKMHPETSREMFYTSYFIHVLQCIQLQK